MSETRSSLLIVEDTDIILDNLIEMLGDEYDIRVATDGISALQVVEKCPPDLILLDIIMPGMDGYEVCRLIKADPATRDIPVIFLTSLGDDADEMKGLGMGAIDYIAKPFNPSVVRTRVHNYMELKKHRDHLEKLVEERTRELATANGKLRMLDAARQDYLRAISHELRTPANGLLGIAELALWEVPDEKMRQEYTMHFDSSRDRLLTAIDAALQLAQFHEERATIVTGPLDVGEVLAKAWRPLEEDFLSRDISFEGPQAKPGPVLGDQEYLRQSITTLLKVVQKMARGGTRVVTEFIEDQTHVTLEMKFQSHPVSETLRNTFFDIFSYERASSYVEDLGLAVPLATEVIKSMGGGVQLQTTHDGMKILLALLRSAHSLPEQDCNNRRHDR